MTRRTWIQGAGMAVMAGVTGACGSAGKREAWAGLTGPVGAPSGAKRMPPELLVIDKPGVYENLLFDGEFRDTRLVRILADDVVLRNCTIRNALKNGVEVRARNVLIENCKIHHLLSSTFQDQHDAHGITGKPQNLTVRNTEIAYVSGDALQFDPGRRLDPYPWDNVVVENCFLWTGPLDADYAGFRRGERPGENAFDSKIHPDAPRTRIVFRNCLMQGWGHGQIGNGAALNLKEKLEAVVEECVFVDNDIAYRCRGEGSYRENMFPGEVRRRPSAWVTTRNCTVYRTSRAFRAEFQVENLKIHNMAYGEGVEQIFDDSSGGHGEGFEYHGKREAPPLAAWPYTRLAVGEVV